MAKITKVQVGEALVGDGNEVAHIDLIIGPRGSPAETAFCNGLINNKHGFTSLLAVIAPNLPCKPNTLMFNKVTINDARQAVQMFGPAQHGVAKAVQDAVAEGIIPADESPSSATRCSTPSRPIRSGAVLGRASLRPHRGACSSDWPPSFLDADFDRDGAQAPSLSF